MFMQEYELFEKKQIVAGHRLFIWFDLGEGVARKLCF